MSLSACLSVCLTDRELELSLLSASAAPAAQLCSDSRRERERKLEREVAPLPSRATCRRFDCFQMCVRAPVCEFARGKGGREGKRGNCIGNSGEPAAGIQMRMRRVMTKMGML